MVALLGCTCGEQPVLLTLSSNECAGDGDESRPVLKGNKGQKACVLHGDSRAFCYPFVSVLYF